MHVVDDLHDSIKTTIFSLRYFDNICELDRQTIQPNIHLEKSGFMEYFIMLVNKTNAMWHKFIAT